METQVAKKATFTNMKLVELDAWYGRNFINRGDTTGIALSKGYN